MAPVTTILGQTWEVRNSIGTLLATFGHRDLAIKRAKALAPERGDLTVQCVTISEDRETVRRVRAPTEQEAA